MTKMILTINCGSSSIKLLLSRFNDEETMVARGQIDRIGLNKGSFQLLDWNGNWLVNEKGAFTSHQQAFERLFQWVKESEFKLDAIGHRVVHGGPNYRNHCVINDTLMRELKNIMSFNPLHLPSEILGIEFAAKEFPHIPQVACLDTAFHSTLPNHARFYAIPRKFGDEGIFRYGFHGLSYEYIMQELGDEAPEKVIVAHLGNGASMAAVKEGTCVDTTMGFTPTEGLMMGTRSGDVDPGLLIYLAAHRNMNADSLRTLLNQESGLKGVSELSSDMKELLDAKGNPKANEALEMFCYRARKAIGSLTAALGGCDMLVFTAGIGERSSEIREKICDGLDAIGIDINPEKNQENLPVISKKVSSTKVLVMRTNEELMIARHTHRLLLGVKI